MTRGAEQSVADDLKQSVVAHYERQLRSHGPTARGMDWKDEASQHLRFAMLCGLCDLDGKSLCEVGCGVGHLYDWLREHRIAARYRGIDLSAEMVEEARRRHPLVSFERRDILVDAVCDADDVVVCSGLFHVKLDHPDDDWRQFVEAVVRRMYAMSGVGIAFNLMSDQVDFRSPALFYANPAWMLDLCRRELSRFVVVRHDYPLHEYTVYVYRHSPVG
jgi:cyclopropane fatty-acyl-phospholipid synthase-like methyltransferase